MSRIVKVQKNLKLIDVMCSAKKSQIQRFNEFESIVLVTTFS